MCFPLREQGHKEGGSLFVYCVCHNEPKHIFYRCLSCNAPQCEISAACKVCKVMLVSAVHLARTRQHSKEVMSGVVQTFEKIKDYVKLENHN